MRVVAALLCACVLLPDAAAAASSVDAAGDLRLMTERFDAWQAAHNRTYATADERRRRFEVYRRNVEHIESTNRRGRLSYRLGENQFADLTGDEFRAAYTMQMMLPKQVLAARKAMRRLVGVASNGSSYADEDAGAVPNSVDWRSKGAVTPPRSQMSCGSCWAFATVASIESLYKLKTGRLVPLSEQELVDCDTPPGDHGCAGGWPGVAMEWIARNGGGLATAEAYPYESRQGRCRRDGARVGVAGIRGGAAVARRDEAALERAVARQPVTALINGDGFQFYRGGVFSGACDARRTNHAVTVVGYGAEPGPGGRKYWIVKNSWGEGWGEKGYVRMERRVKAKEGMCGIATMPHYPVM
ncbi:hypothetical protein PR202_gb21502 [Eleusine coracana subsp. coracana]|uniref:Uncharacterized protein n=1 Tax=Eleusine coracana subsp. coracana TaxID=191504 RepID=A0AAV5FBA9_ELECO|nr:hypothetical protein QOZ80_7BG0606770 [Eleusine coracana subsp. coracana]GJN32954.1 hypothetical protein PR202_gb21502 [Eleusine coracana subsp. coracana]